MFSYFGYCFSKMQLVRCPGNESRAYLNVRGFKTMKSRFEKLNFPRRFSAVYLLFRQKLHFLHRLHRIVQYGILKLLNSH